MGILASLLRISGVPPLVGFFGKIVVLKLLILHFQLWVAGLMVILSGAFLFVYFRLAVSCLSGVGGGSSRGLRKSSEILPSFTFLCYMRLL